MPTNIRLSSPLLAAVDRRARAHGVSRSEWIQSVLERELESGGAWTPGFFDRLAAVDAGTAAAVEDLLASIRRTSV